MSMRIPANKLTDDLYEKTSGGRLMPTRLDGTVLPHIARGIKIHGGLGRIFSMLFGSGTITVQLENKTYYLSKGSCAKFITGKDETSSEYKTQLAAKSNDIFKALKEIQENHLANVEMNEILKTIKNIHDWIARSQEYLESESTPNYDSSVGLIKHGIEKTVILMVNARKQPDQESINSLFKVIPQYFKTPELFLNILFRDNKGILGNASTEVFVNFVNANWQKTIVP